MKTALIGAGVAGAACVSVLRSRGADFCVFEKSRGPGGRLSTRRVSGVLPQGDLHYDHGAPAFTWSPELSAQLAAELKHETVRQLNPDAWVASPSMPQLVKDLLGGCPLSAQVEIDTLEGSTGQWYLKEKSKSDGNPPVLRSPFSAVVLTAPAPQTRALLRNVECSWKQKLDAVSYHPCWAVMASFAGAPAEIRETSNIFSSLVSQNSKPGRTLPEHVQCWVGHAHPEWSRAHLEAEAAVIQEKLLAELVRVLGLTSVQPLHAAVHRWRYSTVANPLHCTALADPVQRLFFAGDACLGTGVAGAVESGLEVGRMLI